MRQTVAFCILLVLFAGCGEDDKGAQTSRSVSVDELAVTVRDHPRNYFLSDKRGGFLIGKAGQGTEQRHEWSVDGQILLHDVGSISVDGKTLEQTAIDSVRVTPLEVVRYFHNGIVETTAPLDHVLGEGRAHALAVQVQAASPHDIMVAIQPGADFLPAPRRETRSILFRKEKIGSLAYSAGAQGEISPGGIAVRQASKAVFVVAYAPGDSADYLAERAQAEVELLHLARHDRMEDLLRRAYLQTSDHELTRAIRWLQLSLDGLIIISPETTAVTLLPWDGSLNARDNSIALAGLDVATGDYAATAGILRAIARRQDASIEGAGWFAREAYEHVIASGDTALVRGLYPAVLANLAHAAQQHADGNNFLLEDKAGSPGYSSADLQALWYFQQTISSIFASFMADTVNAARWAMQADGTLSAFNRLFVDTTRQVVNPRIAADGQGMDYTLPGPLLCLDVIESEAVRQNTVKGIMKALLRPVGLESPPVPGGTGNGIIYNWMAGQMVYALTRYDCQHISYPITRRLADRILTADMVGALPEMYEANGEARALGSQASLAAMAEFIRSFYQDYLGVHINMTTQSLALEPKLPDEIDNVDFTIFAGDHPISARYERKPESDHVVLRGEGFSDSLRVTFLWMMKSGDAWRGATALYPGRTTTLIFGERDATALIDGKQTPMEGVRHLVGFSQRAQMEGF